MKTVAWNAAKSLLLACLLVVVAGLVAPMIGANHYRAQIQAALEKALGRSVEVGAVHLNVFTGVGFAVERVVIHEDPAFGVEPVAYVGSLEAVPRVWSLFTRKLEFASIRLDDASINLTKTGGPAEPGRWNFAPLLTRSLLTAFPEIHVRTGRINFKFGDTKSAFYLINTDLDISPPSRRNGDWSIRFSGAPARTDRPARGFGDFTARGRWSPPRNGNRDNLDLDLELEQSSMAEMITLLHGETIGIHGGVSARLRLRGPLDDIRINGRMTVEDVHRWDLLPPKGQGWPLGLQGRLNLAAQTLELESSTSEREALPLAVRVRVSDYLSQPRWAASLYWNRFPLGPLVDLARHMGAPLPENVKLAGTIDGAITWDGGMRGQLSFRDTAVAISNTPPIRFERARLVFDGSRAELTPAMVRLANEDEAQLGAVYDWSSGTLDIAVSTARMRVEALRSQVALAAVPWLDQVTAGTWNGELHYGWKRGRRRRLERRNRTGGRRTPARRHRRAAQNRDGARASRRRAAGARTHAGERGQAALPGRVPLRAAAGAAAPLPPGYGRGGRRGDRAPPAAHAFAPRRSAGARPRPRPAARLAGRAAHGGQPANRRAGAGRHARRAAARRSSSGTARARGCKAFPGAWRAEPFRARSPPASRLPGRSTSSPAASRP